MQFKAFLSVSILLFSLGHAMARELSLQKGDHVCLVGNELGERMQHHNYWETLLHQSFAEHELSVRNLCFPGDEPQERIRSKNFGTPHDQLARSKATVVVYFFGFNESFDGADGIEDFKQDLATTIKAAKKANFSGEGAPRIALVSPIAFEDTGDPHLPDGKEHNKRLADYTQAMQSVAEEHGVAFANVFDRTRQLFEAVDERLTLNGCHLNDEGYRRFAPILLTALCGKQASDFNRAIRTEVADKNFHWWHRYRAVNGFSIYGDRGKAGRDGTGEFNNEMVMERERDILGQMADNRDKRIWALAKGETIAAEADDSNTLPFFEPTTNVGAPNDKETKKGKLGSLDYLTSEEQLKLFKLAPGFKIELVASEEQFPELSNPVALQFDAKGRPWVSVMPSYPHWKPKSKLDDKLLILEDKNNDGKTDVCKVFAGGLHQPTGFELGRGGVYIAQQPDILFLTDQDGDDKADTRIRKLVGFDSADSHHGLAAFEWGPGGQLYFQEGTFKFSQVECPHGPTRLAEGGIWVYNPATEKLSVHASFAFSNPWGHCFDAWGQDFIGDASPGFAYWAAPITGHIEYPAKHPGGSQHGRVYSLSGGGEGYGAKYRFPRFYEKRVRPSAGCALVSSGNFPKAMQGNFLVTNCIGERTVLNHRVTEFGSGFVGEEVEAIVSCEDGNFRPVDLQFAPDGSLYIVDWHNALIGHLQHNLRDPSRDHSHGRIWRVSYEANPLGQPAKIAGAAVKDLLELLSSYEDRTRYRVRREIAARPASEVLPVLAKWTMELRKDEVANLHQLTEALWLQQTFDVVELELLRLLLNADDPRGRAAAVRVLSFSLHKINNPLDLLEPRVNDPHPRVRLEAVRALSFMEGLDVVELALGVLENENVDEYLQYTLDETMRVLEQ